MCLSKAYVEPDAGVAEPELLMENVVLVAVRDDSIRLTNLFGQSEELAGNIVSVDFTEGRLVLKRRRQ